MNAVPRVLGGLLAERGMTAADLARLSGVSAAAISNALHGKAVPSPVTLRAIETVLGTTAVTDVAVQRARCALLGCRRQFVKGRPFQRYCRRSCADRAADLRRADGRRRRTGSQLAAARRDITRMCAECVGGSLVCVQSDCPLRAWSPYPLVARRRATA